MTAVLLILALDLAMLAHLWHRAAVEAQAAALVRLGRIGALNRTLAHERALARIDSDALEAVTRQKEEAIEQMRRLDRRMVHLDRSRDDACIEASKLRAKLAFERQETQRLRADDDTLRAMVDAAFVGIDAARLTVEAAKAEFRRALSEVAS